MGCHPERSEESTWNYDAFSQMRMSCWILRFAQNDKRASASDAPTSDVVLPTTPPYFAIIVAKNFFPSATNSFGSAWKVRLSVSIAITPDQLDFFSSAKRPV